MTELHGARFKIAFEKACGYETPTTEGEVGEFVDITFARAEPPSWTSGFRTQTEVWEARSLFAER